MVVTIARPEAIRCWISTVSPKRMIRSKKMECERMEGNKFNCTSTVISAWVRIWDTTYYKSIIEHCGMKWHEQYQDVMYCSDIVDNDIGRCPVSLVRRIK